MKRKSTIDSLDEVSLPTKEDKQQSESKIEQVINSKNFYVNNKELYNEYVEYNKTKVEALAQGEPVPPLTNKIGEAILQIASRYVHHRRFYGYSRNWKEDMVGNAAMTMAIRGHGFDPNKGNNPFAYLTQICKNAIWEQINRERTELYVKYKTMSESGGFVAEIGDDDTDPGISYEDNSQTTYDRLSYIQQFEEQKFAKKQKEVVEGDQGIFKLDDEEVA